MYVARMDYQDIAQRKLTKATEMFWAPSPSQPMQGGVLGFLPFWYYAPSGFNFGGDDGTQPVIDCGGCPEDNTADVLARFEALVAQQVGFTAGNDVMLMMATDFSMENAFTWCVGGGGGGSVGRVTCRVRGGHSLFESPHIRPTTRPPHTTPPRRFRNIDRLIALVNANSSNLNVFYSTPSIYTAAKASSTALPLRTEDVMPYSDDGACPCGIRSAGACVGCYCVTLRALPTQGGDQRKGGLVYSDDSRSPPHAPPPLTPHPPPPQRTPSGAATSPPAPRSRATSGTAAPCSRWPSSCRPPRRPPRTCRPPTPCSCWSAPSR